MRTILILGLLAGCAWNKGELSRWDKVEGAPSDKQLVDVGAEADEVKKFTVENTETPPTPIPITPATKISTVKKTEVKVVEKKPVVAPVTRPIPVPKPSTYPADYPAELIAVDEKARPAWNDFKPSFSASESLYLNVAYLGMDVGKIAMRYRGVKVMNGKEVYHFQARLKTAPFYSAIYELDDTVETFVDKEKFLGLRYNLVQRESKQNVDEVQLYDREKLRTSAYQKSVRDGKTKNKKWDNWMPRLSLDGFSMAYFIRGLPWKDGSTYAVPVVNKGKTTILTLRMEAKEKIKTHKGQVEAFRVHVISQYSGTTLKSGDMMLWLANTPGKELLRIKASIKIGSVYAETAEGD